MLESVNASLEALLSQSSPRKLSIASWMLTDVEHFGIRFNFSSEGEMREYGFEESLEEVIRDFIERDWENERTEILFDGDRFVPSKDVWEEESAPFEEMDLPLLGECKVYRSLGRIRYIEESVYAEDYDDPATAHYSSASISIEAYLARLNKRKEAIEEAIEIFSP